jgi:hypothetical protein
LQLVPLYQLSYGLSHIIVVNNSNVAVSKAVGWVESMLKDTDFMKNWKQCDGHVKDVESAMVAMVMSIGVSVGLIIVIEKYSLSFYKKAEENYQSIEPI